MAEKPDFDLLAELISSLPVSVPAATTKVRAEFTASRDGKGESIAFLPDGPRFDNLPAGTCLELTVRRFCAMLPAGKPRNGAPHWCWDECDLADFKNSRPERTRARDGKVADSLFFLIDLLILAPEYIEEWPSPEARFRSLLQRLLPTTASIDGVSVEDFLRVARKKDMPQPVYCLANLASLSLDAFAVRAGKVRLRPCLLCGRLFFAVHDRAGYCDSACPLSPECSCKEYSARLRAIKARKAVKAEEKAVDAILNAAFEGANGPEFRDERKRFRDGYVAFYKDRDDDLPSLDLYDKRIDYLKKAAEYYEGGWEPGWPSWSPGLYEPRVKVKRGKASILDSFLSRDSDGSE